MSDQRYKVVTTTDGTTVNAGAQPKDSPPQGLTKDQATKDSVMRNDKATEMGLNTRYEVTEL